LNVAKVLLTFLVWIVVPALWLHVEGLVGSRFLSAIEASQVYHAGTFAVLCLIAVLLSILVGQPLVTPPKDGDE
jgi:hypothetical protein